jgi:hypothetical protein
MYRVSLPEINAVTREGVGGVVDGWGADQEREGGCLGKGRESEGPRGCGRGSSYGHDRKL